MPKLFFKEVSSFGIGELSLFMQIIKNRIVLITVILAATFLLQGKAFSDEAEEHFQKGHRFYLGSKSAEAEAEFKKALELNPKLSDAHYYLGSIYFKQERYSEAVKQCEQALRINNKDLKSLIIMGLSLQQLGLLEEAIEKFQKAETVDSQSAAVHSALGLAYCVKGDVEKAKGEYEILKEIGPELAEDLLERIRPLLIKE